MERLDGEKAAIERDMAQPAAYANGERMRELTRGHEENRRMHDAAMQRWESLASQADDLKKRLAGLRP